jgi:hypothetical protein
MRAARLLGLAALVAAGCTSGKGDSLVVVTVDAVPALSRVAVLHTTSMAGGQTIAQDVGGGGAPFSIGGGVQKTFGVQVPHSITGAFAIHVEARDASGKVLGAGDGMTTLSPGNRSDLTVVLGAAIDGGVDGGTDGGTDGMPPPILSQSVYVASGGSAASATQQLNVNVGGTDTTGGTSAPSGATFMPGFFASQTY